MLFYPFINCVVLKRNGYILLVRGKNVSKSMVKRSHIALTSNMTSSNGWEQDELHSKIVFFKKETNLHDVREMTFYMSWLSVLSKLS